jgi:hypothetical protein
MLRLAVGNRSQWCSVGEGFKIIVVVETKDAYEKLDLPLLNRFEKQMLRASDALEDDSKAKQRLALLEAYVEETEAGTYHYITFCVILETCIIYLECC